MHDETYRMLGREHEVDLERDARKWRRAAEVRAAAHTPAEAAPRKRRIARSRFVALLTRASRAGA